jgi:alpha-glucosidase
LPQPKEWRDLTVAAELASPGSMLRLYTEGLRIRRAEGALRGMGMRWLPAPDGVLAFDRLADGAAVRCVVNLSPGLVSLPPGGTVLLASGPLDDGLLPPDTTAWLRAAP